MKKIAVFGKPGGGKSTLSKKLSRSIGVPLYPLDLIEYNPDGTKVDVENFDTKHREIIESEKWIVDGFGTLDSFSERLDAADTFIYIDLPYPIHYWWVIKRFILSIFKSPEGWPDGSNVLKGTIASIKTLRLCPKFWNEEFLRALYANHKDKKIYVVKSVSELGVIIRNVKACIT